MKKTLIAVATLVVLTAWADRASAVPILDFGSTTGGGGTVSYAGGGSPLVGSGIMENTITGTGTANPGPLGALTITGGLLNFQTGAESNPADSTYAWNPGTACPSLGNVGCSITITGGIAGIGLGPGSALFSGQLTSASIVQPGSVVIGLFVDFVNSAVASYFGLGTTDSTPWKSADAIAMNLGNFTFTAPAAFSCGDGSAPCIVASSDLLTTPAPIPEPGSLLLLGTGLIASASGFRRWRGKKA